MAGGRRWAPSLSWWGPGPRPRWRVRRATPFRRGWRRPEVGTRRRRGPPPMPFPRRGGGCPRRSRAAPARRALVPCLRPGAAAPARTLAAKGEAVGRPRARAAAAVGSPRHRPRPPPPARRRPRARPRRDSAEEPADQGRRRRAAGPARREAVHVEAPCATLVVADAAPEGRRGAVAGDLLRRRSVGV